MVGYSKDLYIFGGSNGVNTLNDFWKFSLSTKQWEKIETQNTPSQRRGHSMLIFQNYIFMFGGIQDITKEKNDVYVYEFATKNWRKIHTTTNSVYDCSPTLKK
jgi:N-acetylneuraminic acid mutarotase